MVLIRVGTLGAYLCIAAPAVSAQDISGPPRIAMQNVLHVAELQEEASTEEQIGAVVIVGNEAIEDVRYQSAVEEFFGEPRSEEVLARLTKQIADLARDEGYPYARTSIIENPNGLGVVQISIDEGRVDVVEIEGYQNARAFSMLGGLVGKPVSKAQLERALLLVSDIPAVRLRGANIKRRDGQSVLVIKLDKNDNSFRVEGDNYGTEAFGPYRAVASAVLSDTLSASDQIYASVRINPLDLEELLFASASYKTQLSNSGLTIAASGSVGTTSPGGPFGDSEINGDSLRARLSLSQPVIRSKDVSLWVNATGSYIQIEQDDLGQLLRDDTIVTASIGLTTQWAVAGGRLRAGITHERGLGILGATRRGDLLASRSDGDGVFSKINFWGDLRLPVAPRLDVFLSAGGQIADRPLLSGEEIALGGAYRTRGYNFSEVLGDEGVYGLAELRYRVATENLPLDTLQLYAFVDGGTVSDLGVGVGEGSLFSAGPGVRARIGPFGFEVEGGFPLGGSAERAAENDPQVNVRAGISF